MKISCIDRYLCCWIRVKDKQSTTSTSRNPCRRPRWFLVLLQNKSQGGLLILLKLTREWVVHLILNHANRKTLSSMLNISHSHQHPTPNPNPLRTMTPDHDPGPPSPTTTTSTPPSVQRIPYSKVAGVNLSPKLKAQSAKNK